MIKQLLSIFFIAFIFQSLFSQTEFLADSIFIRDNKISKITNYRATPYDLYAKTKGGSYTVKEYNKDGLLVKQSFYDKNELQGTVQTEYNLKLQVIKKTDVSKINKTETIYKYNEQDQPISIEYLRQNYGNYKYTFEYKDGKKIKQSVYNSGKDLQSVEHYTYKNNRLHTVAYHSGAADTAYIKIQLHYDANGNEVWRKVLKGAGNYYPKKQFNANNQLTHVTYVDYEGKKITGEEFYTWKDGKIIKKKLEMKGSELQTIETECTYTNGLLTQHDYNSNLYRNKASTKWTYDSDSQLVSITHYFDDKLTQNVMYEYNKQKQLISKRHVWPAIGSPPIPSTLDKKHRTPAEVDPVFTGNTTVYTYAANGDTLMKKTGSDKDSPLYIYGKSHYYNSADTTVYDFKLQKEFSMQHGKCGLDQHFQYGFSVRTRIETNDYDYYNYARPVSFDIIDTIENTVVNGKGVLKLKLQPFDLYGQKTKHAVTRSITYESKSQFTAVDSDSLNTILMELQVKDSSYVYKLLVSRTIKNDKEHKIYRYKDYYGARLAETILFDEQKRIIKKIAFGISGLNYVQPETQTITYDYSKMGEVIETHVYSTGFTQTKVHFYNDKNQETRELLFDLNGQIHIDQEFILKNGRCIGTKSHLPAARYIDRYEYEFYK